MNSNSFKLKNYHSSMEKCKYCNLSFDTKKEVVTHAETFHSEMFKKLKGIFY